MRLRYRKVWALLAGVSGLCASVVSATPTRDRPALAPMVALQKAKWIAEGSVHPRHIIYVFVDANCPYCHELWHALRSYYQQGLQVRALLVGVISASSPGKAAAIFDARNPSAALRLNEVRWGDGPDHGGGIAPTAHPSARDLRDLAHNEALMEAFQLNGTPGLVFADAEGRIYVLSGLPAKKELPRIVQAAARPDTKALGSRAVGARPNAAHEHSPHAGRAGWQE